MVRCPLDRLSRAIAIGHSPHGTHPLGIKKRRDRNLRDGLGGHRFNSRQCRNEGRNDDGGQKRTPPGLRHSCGAIRLSTNSSRCPSRSATTARAPHSLSRIGAITVPPTACNVAIVVATDSTTNPRRTPAVLAPPFCG